MTEIISSISKYNFWNENHQDLGFIRSFYTEKIKHYIGNKLVKVLVGQRRTGKSYILRQLISKLIEDGIPSRNTLYINKEYMDYASVKNADDLEALYRAYLKDLTPEGKVYIFLDEIQLIDKWEIFVNSHSQDFAQACELFITGSNSNLLSKELATLLSGRYIDFEILTFSFDEYCGIKSLKRGKESYLDFLADGSLPELFNLSGDEMRRNYVSSIKDTVILRDIVERYKIKDAKLLDDLFTYLANNAANMVSINNIVNFFKSKNRKTNYETVSNYIAYLENSFLVHKAERYNIKGKDSISGNSKYYMNDLAYYNHLYGGYAYGTGFLLENAVYLNLRRLGYTVYTGVIGGTEVDFVALRGEKKIYLQVSAHLLDKETFDREYRSLKLIGDNFAKYVVSLDEYRIPSNEGIEHVSAWNLNNIL